MKRVAIASPEPQTGNVNAIEEGTSGGHENGEADNCGTTRVGGRDNSLPAVNLRKRAANKEEEEIVGVDRRQGQGNTMGNIDVEIKENINKINVERLVTSCVASPKELVTCDHGNEREIDSKYMDTEAMESFKNEHGDVEFKSVATEKEVKEAAAARLRLGFDQFVDENLVPNEDSAHINQRIGKTDSSKAETSPKLPNGPEPMLLEFRYIPTSSLEPLQEPEQFLTNIEVQLSSSHWNTVCDGLNVLRRLSIFHKKFLLIGMKHDTVRHDAELSIADKNRSSGDSVLAIVMPLVIKSLRSPRSSLCKTAIMCLNDLFSTLTDNMLPWLRGDDKDQNTNQSLLMALLQKAAQDKRFVAEEAQNSLKTLSQSASPLPLLRIFHPCVHSSNPRIRGAASTHMACIVSRLSVDDIREFTMVQLIRDGGKLLTDKLPEARSSARKIVEQMYALFQIDSTFGDCDNKVEEAEEMENERVDTNNRKGNIAVDDLTLEAPTDSVLRFMTATSSGIDIVELTSDEQWCTFCKKNLDATTASSVMRVTGSQNRSNAAFSTI